MATVLWGLALGVGVHPAAGDKDNSSVLPCAAVPWERTALWAEPSAPLEGSSGGPGSVGLPYATYCPSVLAP